MDTKATGVPPRTKRRTREVETDPEQAYFWTEEWQAGEREAIEQRDAGKGEVFLDARDMLRALDSERAERDGI